MLLKPTPQTYLPSPRVLTQPSSWLHPRNYFDYIHSRHTVMAIKDWPKLMRRALEYLPSPHPPFHLPHH